MACQDLYYTMGQRGPHAFFGGRRPRAFMLIILPIILICYYRFDDLKELHRLYFVQPYQIEILEWVCITPRKDVKNIDSCHVHNSHLVVHKAHSNYKQTVKGQTVEFTSDDIPEHYEILSDHTAIINGYAKHFLPGNLYHFVNQYYVPFHHLLHVWKMLNLTKESDIFHSRTLLAQCKRNSAFISFFLDTLGKTSSAKFGYNYHAHPGNVCYRYGLFSDLLYPDHKQSAVEHVWHYYGVAEKPCPKQNQILLLQRKLNRFWLNIESVHRALIQAGYINTSIVNFDEISVENQLRTMYCAHAFVASHSAAMEWAYFMRPNSLAIEIVWSRYGWLPYYATLNSYTFKLPVNIIALNTEDVIGHAYSIEAVKEGCAKIFGEWLRGMLNIRYNKLLTEEQLKTMYVHRGLGKSSNFSVNPELMTNAIKKLVELR